MKNNNDDSQDHQKDDIDYQNQRNLRCRVHQEHDFPVVLVAIHVANDEEGGLGDNR